MTAPPDEAVTLKLGGQVYGGWSAIKISSSMEATAATFEVTVSERWLQGIEPTLPEGLVRTRPIAGGDLCEVLIGSTVLCTGQVERVHRAYGSDGHLVSISGRSRTGDLVDSSIEADQQIRGKRLEAIAQQLCEPFGIAVVAEVDTGPPIDEFHAKSGETVHGEIQKLCALRSLLVSDGPGGDLVITAIGAGRSHAPIRAGHDAIKSASAEFDVTHRHSAIICKGQQPIGGSGLRDGTSVALGQGAAPDPEVKRHRPLVIQAKGRATPDDCTKRAEHEMRRRQGRSREVGYTVQGWRDAAGKLWWKNQIRRVVDPLLGLDDDHVIKSVAFAIDPRSGSITTLSLTLPDAYAGGGAAKAEASQATFPDDEGTGP